MSGTGVESAETSIPGFIFDIQRYSIHDGPGIRTNVFIKGCPLRCFWCQNPESQHMRPELMFDSTICTLCGSCVSVCPVQANMVLNGELKINREKCSGCGKCVDICPAETRKTSGRAVTVGEVLEVVMKDKAMYEKSSGGLTISGGDPVFQPKFSTALLKEAKKRGLHTAVETCGCTNWEVLKEILEYTDYLLFDIKAIDSQTHLDGTGADNQIIMDNAKKAAMMNNLTMRVRVPLIPGYNDSEESIEKIVSFVTDEIGLPAETLSLLKYNKYMESKYERLGRGAQLKRLEPQSEECFDKLNRIISQRFKV